MMKNTIIALIIFCTAYTLNAAESSPYNFLRYISSARAAGLAGNLVQMTEEPTGLFFNPATISTVEEKKFSATFLKHVLDINSGNISLIRHYDDFGTVGGAIAFTNYGSFIETDKTGNQTGNFGANDLMFQATYSNILDSNFYWGGSIKLIYVNIEDAGSMAFAVDAGLLYMLPDSRTNIGLSILHAGAQISKFAGRSESLPLDIRMGINHRLRGLPLLVNFSFHHLADTEGSFTDKFKNFTLAGELYLGESIRLRAGFDNQVRQYVSPGADKGLSGFTGGLGIVASSFNIDYGIAQYGSAATLHRFSINFNLID